MVSSLVLDAQSKLFSLLIQHLAVYAEYIRITVTLEECLVVAVNESQTSLCNMKLVPEWFSEYTVTSSMTLTIRTSILYKIMHVLDDTQPVALQFHTNELVIKGKSLQSDVVYTIPSLHIDIPDIDVPEDIEYAADITMPSKTWCSVLEHLMIVGEDCSFTVEEDSMQFRACGDYGSTHIDVTIEEMNSYVVEENIKLELHFHLKLLHIVSLFHKMSDVIEIHVSSDMPLVLQYTMKTNSYIRFMIAPKIVD